MKTQTLIASVVGLAASTLSAPLAAETLPNDAAAEPDAVKLDPVSPWNIDFGQSRCRLTRVFGSEDNQHLVFIEQAAPRGNFGMTLAGSSIEPFQNRNGLYLGLKNDEEMAQPERLGVGEVASLGPAIILSNEHLGSSDPESEIVSAGIDLDQATKVDRIVLMRGDDVLSFETGNMMPPMQALNTCTSDLLRDWGLDQDKHQAYTPPVWTNERWITRRFIADYPRDALRSEEQGIFRMRVIVELDGTVSECHMENSTQTEVLESPACKVMMRARFDPAFDAEGNAMRSFYATTITYSLSG